MWSHRVSMLAGVLVLVLVAAGALGAAAQSTTTVEGTIATATATSAVITTKTGSTTITLNDKTRVIRRLPATLADVKVGTFLAVTASKAADGTLTAVSVNIVDEMPNARKGQWPMESGNIMTNMNVTSIVSGVSGRTVKLSYQNQNTSIVVPNNTPVRRIVLGKLTDLKTGEHVTVRGENDGYGVITATYVSIQ
ncbi:MAG TPA: DUF5666 domain-containing protein [bacterium]|nr:DUF5666 domain-containing protein [bacterium]